MTKTLDEILAELPTERRTAVEQRADVLLREIEGLRELRQLAGKSQEQLAASLGIRQPSVHKMERQADLYLSTLRRFVEAAGGSLELRVELPGKGTFRLSGLSDVSPEG